MNPPEKATMNFLDRTIAVFSPRMALQRMAAKQHLVQFGYNDHPERRGQAPPLSRTAGETWEKHRDRLKSTADAREQAEYTWIGGVVGRIVNYVVGELVCKSNTGDPEVDAAYDNYLHNWAGDEEDEDGCPPCDVTGRHRLIKHCQIAMGAMIVDGDHGVQWFPGDETKMPALLSIDSDRIGSPNDSQQREDYIGGVNIDAATGRVLSYRVFKRTRAGQYTDPVDVPTSNFFHVWDSSRGDEYRGRTHLLKLLNANRDLAETETAESLAIKTQSQYAVMLTSKAAWSDKSAGAWSGKTDAGTPTQKVDWGKMLRLAEGESVTGFQPTARPTGSFLAFEQVRIRQMAQSLKFSYGFVWNMAELGGATARVEVKGDARQIACLRRTLVDKLLRRVRRKLLDHGIAYGHLPAHPNMANCKWHFGQDIIVDAGYEVQNDIMLLKAGLTDPDTVAVKYNNGEDFAGVIGHKAGAFNRVREIAAETGTTLEILAGDLWPGATAQIAARETPPEETQPQPGTVQALGEKGAAQVFEILKSVAEGTLDRESALQTLVSVWQLPPEQAAAILPKPAKKEATQKEATQEKEPVDDSD